LKIVKAEFAPGKAYENDVPGLYAQVMLQALRAVAREALWRRNSEPTQKKSTLTSVIHGFCPLFWWRITPKDHPDTRPALEMFLQLLGHQTKLAADGVGKRKMNKTLCR
jgi:hypothetical protein